MYELVQITKNSGYIQCPAKIGIIQGNENNVYLIDSGNDKDAGRKVRQLLDANHWHLAAIYHTHSHADHIGGNQYLQAKTGCKIYVPDQECGFVRHPILEPSFLYGAFPPRDLQHKFLLAKESNAQILTEDVLPQGVQIIPLPGHSYAMVGYRTADGVVYLADCLSSQETLSKYQIAFLYDVEAYLHTLEQVKTMSANMFVPAHAEATENIVPLAQYNIDKTLEIAEQIRKICKEKISFEQLLQKLFTHYALSMDFSQYVLVGNTVRAYLTWLKEKGEIQADFQNNMLVWQQI